MLTVFVLLALVPNLNVCGSESFFEKVSNSYAHLVLITLMTILSGCGLSYTGRQYRQLSPDKRCEVAVTEIKPIPSIEYRMRAVVTCQGSEYVIAKDLKWVPLSVFLRWSPDSKKAMVLACNAVGPNIYLTFDSTLHAVVPPTKSDVDLLRKTILAEAKKKCFTSDSDPIRWACCPNVDSTDLDYLSPQKE
jgi:hypothetical protein